MSAKHTPGPWKAVARPVGRELWRTRVIYEDCRENIIADTYTQHYGPGKDEDEANARLIVKAPDLQDEVSGVLRQFDRDNIPKNQEERPSGSGVRVHFTYRQADRLRALLAEVEGES